MTDPSESRGSRCSDGGRVLVAEDDRFYRTILARRLEAAGHEVILTADGQEAWERLVDDPPEVLVSDWMMPRLDGQELCSKVKAAPERKSIYCILLTAKDRVEDTVAALDGGADDYLVKPCDEGELLARVRAGLRAHRRCAQLERESVTDTLTGLHNRRYLDERMAEEIARARRYGTPLSLVMIDIDQFKQVNDRYGHLIGDSVLMRVGEILRERIRRGEVAARIGGDEFAVLLPSTPIEGAEAFGAWVQERLARLHLDDDACRGIETGASTGCAQLAPSWDAQALLKSADDALYESKLTRTRTARP